MQSCVSSVSAYEQPVWAKSDTPQLLAHMKCERPPCERTPPALKTRHSEQLIHSPPPSRGAGEPESPMNDSNYIISPKKAPSTPPRPSHIEHTTATWICWAAAHCAFRLQGAAKPAVPRAPRQPLLLRTRLVARIALLTAALPATARFARRLAVAVRGRAGIAPPPRTTCAAAGSKTTASRLTVGNFACPAGRGAATPGPHSTDTKVLRKASLVFMSLLNDGSMSPCTAGGSTGLTCSATQALPTSRFFAIQ